MSSSPRPAPLPPQFPAPASKPVLEAFPFPYAEAAAAAGARNFVRPSYSSAGMGSSAPESQAKAEREAQVRESSRQQAGIELRAKFEEQLARDRSAIAQALTDFAHERAAYYQKIEEEAVRLALRVARKVLHREAQVDPTALMGILRVALDRIEGATGVALAVHPEKAAAWRSYVSTQLRASQSPQIVEDAALAPDQCQLRTSMGTAGSGPRNTARGN